MPTSEAVLNPVDQKLLEMINLRFREAVQGSHDNSLIMTSLDILACLAVPYALHRGITVPNMLSALSRILKERMEEYLREMNKEMYH